jgi:hypothetical protein
MATYDTENTGHREVRRQCYFGCLDRISKWLMKWIPEHKETEPAAAEAEAQPPLPSFALRLMEALRDALPDAPPTKWSIEFVFGNTDRHGRDIPGQVYLRLNGIFGDAGHTDTWDYLKAKVYDWGWPIDFYFTDRGYFDSMAITGPAAEVARVMCFIFMAIAQSNTTLGAGRDQPNAEALRELRPILALSEHAAAAAS